MKIVLVRHGSVDEKYQKCYNGHLDIRLSRKGKREAKQIAKMLENIHFDTVYSSDLLRAKETLVAFKESKNAIFTAALREKFWGKYEGMGFEEIVATKELSYEDFTQWIEALGGEPYALYKKRIKSLFFEHIVKQNAQSVLVVTHAGVIRTLIAIVQNLSLEETFCIEIPYASATIFDTDLQTFSTIK